MVNINSVAQSLEVEKPIDLFSLTNPTVDDFPNYNFCNIDGVIFGGTVYSPVACKSNWVSKSSDTTEPEIKLFVGDTEGVVGAIIDNYGLIGAEITVKRTWSIFLDNSPASDPLSFYQFNMRINQYTGEYGYQFEFELIPLVSLERKKLPGRLYLRRCQWQLGDENCNAPSNINYDLAGNSTDAANRACGKDLDSCRRYHGHVLNFGGFPGVQIRR